MLTIIRVKPDPYTITAIPIPPDAVVKYCNDTGVFLIGEHEDGFIYPPRHIVRVADEHDNDLDIEYPNPMVVVGTIVTMIQSSKRYAMAILDRYDYPILTVDWY